VSPGCSFLHRQQAGGQGHAGLQVPVCAAALGVVGRAAVQHDACAHPVGAHLGVLRVAQRGGAVAQAALAGQVARGQGKGGHLVGDAARPVGVGEMRHERDFLHLRQGVQARPGGAVALGREAQAVHARVHLEEHAVRHLRLVGSQPVDLGVAVHGVPQAQARAQFQVARLEHAFKQQDGAAPAQVADALGLLQVQQGKAVGGAKGLEHPLDAVPVGIGLDHGPDACVGSGLLRARQVVLQCSGVDGGKNGTGHGGQVRAGEWKGILAPGRWNPRVITACHKFRPPDLIRHQSR
jgi:hypothetical protein